MKCYPDEGREKEREIQNDRGKEKETDRRIERERERETDRQTDRQTYISKKKREKEEKKNFWVTPSPIKYPQN